MDKEPPPPRMANRCPLCATWQVNDLLLRAHLMGEHKRTRDEADALIAAYNPLVGA
jgi:hypothetical protein